jgi:hypothetical protein
MAGKASSGAPGGAARSALLNRHNAVIDNGSRRVILHEAANNERCDHGVDMTVIDRGNLTAIPSTGTRATIKSTGTGCGIIATGAGATVEARTGTSIISAVNACGAV